MKARTPIAVFLLLVLSAPGAFPAAAAPTLVITGPGNGSTQITRSVEVNGTARGSTVDWLETLHEDFELGTIENLSNDAAGSLFLNRTAYERFDGNAIDPGRWSVSSENGLGASVGGGELLLSGNGMADGWTSLVQLVSTVPVSDKVNGTMKQFMEMGTGAYSILGFYQDQDNFIAVGQAYDFFGLGPGQKVVLASSVSGSFTLESLGATNNVPHTFSLSYDGSSVALSMDGTQLTTRAFALKNAKCMIRAAVNATNEFVSASWDDIICLYFTAGRFTSAVYDTLSDAPELTSVAWTANVPDGLSLGVQLRSADNQYMTGASGWVDVTPGQSSGFPAFERFLQYTVNFDSPAGNGTALFRDILTRYICEVRAVEVSIDNRTTWAQAAGTEDWNITLNIPDGQCRILVRVTDVTGERQEESLVIDVDTTEPQVSLLINDGSELTQNSLVNLTILASDAYGVKHMLLSESENFTGAEWQPYARTLDWKLSAGDGTKTVYVKVRDANGWESVPASATVAVDTLSPVGTIRINNGANYTGSPTVTLYLNASDASGVSDMLLSNRVDFGGDDWLPYTPTYTWNLLPGAGPRTVSARFRDPAGHISVPVSALIVLDPSPPEFTITIDNGSTYALSYTVELQINASDDIGVGDMLLSSNSQFSGAVWEPWSQTRRWTLPAVDGPATVHAKVRDIAGNEAQPQSDSILVDTVAPLCVISSLPATTATLNFTVSWAASDTTSGVVDYDVQYREGTGDWIDWMVHVTNQTAVFSGTDGSTYTFRARSRDVAGNLGAYPENPKTTTTIKLPVPGSRLPIVSILTPMSSAPYSGKVDFAGTARALTSGRSIVSVQWQVDNGAWLTASGTENWSFEWNTVGAKQGTHALRVRSFDGVNYSAVAERSVSVDNPVAPGGGMDLTPVLLILVVVIVAGALVGVFVMRRKRRTPAEPAPAPAPPGAVAVRSTAPAPSAGQGAGEGKGPETAAAEAAPAPSGERALASAAPTEGAPAATTVAADGPPPAAAEAAPAGAETTSALPPLDSTPRPPLELVRQLDPAAILQVVRALYYSLPGELQFMQPDVIAQLVVTGEQGKSKTGEPLVLIMNRWYFSDETKANFLQRYNW